MADQQTPNNGRDKAKSNPWKFSLTVIDRPNPTLAPCVSEQDRKVARPPSFPFSILFVVWLLVLLTATLVTFVLPESFCGTARVRVEKQQSEQTSPNFTRTECEIIRSELVLNRVVQSLELNTVWGKKYYNGQKLKISEALLMLRGCLDVREVRNTDVIEIRAYSENSNEAVTLANVVAESYQTLCEEERRRTRANELEFRAPVSRMVQIIEKAVPTGKPVRPNKPFNISLGAVAGGIAGSFLASLVYLLQYWSFKRCVGLPDMQLLTRLRFAAHIVNALVCGIVVGYHCAMPLTPSSLVVVPVCLLVAALLSAWIALAKPLSQPLTVAPPLVTQAGQDSKS